MRRWAWVALLSIGLVGLPALTYDAEAGYSSGRSSMRRSSSSSSRRTSPSRSSSSSSRTSSQRSSSGYSSGKGTSYSSGKGSSDSSSSRAASGTGSFGAAAAARRQEASSGVSNGARSPSAASSTFGSSRRNDDPRQRQMVSLRSRLNAEAYSTRPLREERFYGSYFGRPSPMFNDGYSPWFWLWLLDRQPHQQAAWLHHHRDTMDPARYESVVRENAGLRARIEELEKQNTPRDPTYVPVELADADLMYSGTFAAAATQPSSSDWPQDDADWPPLERADSDPLPAASGNAFPRSSSWPRSSWNDSSMGAREPGWPPLLQGFVLVAAVLFGVTILCRLASRKQSSWRNGPMPPPLPARAPPLPPYDDEFASDNPLSLEVGQTFTLDMADYEGMEFSVEQMLHYTTVVAGRIFRYTAYWGVARPSGEDRVVVQIRVERLDDGGLAVLALRLHDQFEYNQAFYNIVAADGTGRFQITDDDTDEVTAEYFRVGDVQEAYLASATAVNRPGEFLKSRQIQYWDYSRQVDTAAGKMNEYLIVEMEESGWFRILVGPQIDPALVRAQ